MLKQKDYLYLIIVLGVALLVSRGLFRKNLVAGHDSNAYSVTQHQFHINIQEGVVFPRWAPDMRYGFGHAKLQYRPPVLHYLSEVFYLFTGGFIFCINLALIVLVFLAAIGMYFFARQFMNAQFAVIASAAFITTNYYLSDIYLRGAYYEIAAIAWMPWILWTQVLISKELKFTNEAFQLKKWFKLCFYLFAGAFSWCFIICGHPQIAAFFIPLAICFMILIAFREKNKWSIFWNLSLCAIGFLLAAPYFYVAIKELPFVRMQLFYVGLEDYYRNFISVKQLFFESWPKKYAFYDGSLDYIGRPLHPEMRAFNFWALIVLIGVPFFWFMRKNRDEKYLLFTQFFYFWIVATVAVSLSISWGLWNIIDFLRTFNFPWRALAVTSFCVAFLAGLLVSELSERIARKKIVYFVCAVSMLLIIIDAFPHTRGWCAKDMIGYDDINSESIRTHKGIPQEFYTPTWVTNYALYPAGRDLVIEKGQGSIELTSRKAVTWNLKINAKTALEILLAHHYYPGWTLYGIGDAPIKPDISPGGQMAFKIPKGNYDCVLKFDLTRERIVAYSMTAAGLVLLVLGCLMIIVLQKNNLTYCSPLALCQWKRD